MRRGLLSYFETGKAIWRSLRLRSFLRCRALSGVIAVFILISGSDSFAKEEAIPGEKAPGFILNAADGSRMNVREKYQSGPTLINFWATWCHPCAEEMPELQKLHEKYKNDGLSVIAISIDQGPKAKVLKFLKTHAIDIPVLLDTYGIVAKRFGVEGAIPQSFLIRKGGKIEKKYSGFSSEEFIFLKEDVRQLVQDTAD